MLKQSPSLVIPTKSFKERIEEFLKEIDLNEEDQQEFRNEVCKFILTIQEQQGAAVLRAMSRKLNFFEEFKYFKDIYLDKSAYIHRHLWREVIFFIKHKQFRVEEPILSSDILYVVDHLKDSDLEKIISLQINMDVNASLNMDEFTTGENVQRDIYTYVKSKANTLKYISKYDFGIDADDLQHDLIEEVLRVNNAYNKSSGKNINGGENIDNNIKRYIETALNNKVSQIKDYWGSETRRRVNSTHATLYRRRGTLKKAIAKETNKDVLAKLNSELIEIENLIKTQGHDYFSTVTPLVRTNESENREVDSQEIDPSTIEEDNTLENFWAKELLQDLPPRVSRCVSIIMGDFDEEFETWCRISKPKANLDILDNLFRCALEFCKLTKDDLKNNPTIIRALSGNGLMKNQMYIKESDILVQNLITKKLHPARLDDQRNDGSIIFYLVNDKNQKVIDTNFDKKWRLISTIERQSVGV